MKVIKKGCIKMISLLLAVVMVTSVCTGLPFSAAYDLNNVAPVGAARSVTYIDANGNERTIQALPLESDITVLEDEWYFVDGNVTVNSDVALSGDVKLILCDGASLNLGYKNLGSRESMSGTSLTVYRAPGKNEGSMSVWRICADTMSLIGGQINTGFCIDANALNVKGGSLTAERVETQDELNISGGTVDLYSNLGWLITSDGDMTVTGGRLHAKADDGCAIICDGNFTVSGGVVDIEGKIYSYYDGTLFSVTGGTVTTTGDINGKDLVISGGNVEVGGTLFVYNDITLGWTYATDSIKASAYGGADHIIIADGQQLTDGTNIFSGSYNEIDDREQFAGKTLVPYYDLPAWEELQFIIDHSADGATVSLHTDTTADSDDTHLIIPSGLQITLDLKGYTLDRNMPFTLGDGNVITNDGTLTITDTSTAQTGTITGGLTGNNGGCIQNNGTLILEGGTITGNRAYAGGGIANSDNRNKNAVFIMNGGSVTGNTALNTNGGGICNYGYMTMNGGSVTDNSVDKADYSGGGIWTYTSLTITGGSVTGNTAGTSGNGGGIYYYDGALNLSGSPIVTGNTASGINNDLDINGNRTVTITDVLTGDALIGIHIRNEDICSAFTSGLSDRGNASNFISNYSNYTVRLDNDGEAVLKQLYSITKVNPDNGTVTADKSSACEGDTVTLTVTPDEGYTVKTVSVNGSAINAQNDVYSFTMPAENVTVTAEFEKTVYTITYNAEHGTVTGPSGACSGDNVNLSITPATGYRLETLTVTDANSDPVSVDSNNRFTMPANNVTVTAKFRAVRTVTYLDENGDEQTAQAFIVDSNITSLTDSWYCVEGNVNIDDDVAMSGDVKLILCDSASLNLGTNDLGDDETMTGTSLTVYRAPGENEGSLNPGWIYAGTLNFVGGQIHNRNWIIANILNMKGGSLTSGRVETEDELSISGGSVDLFSDTGWIIYSYGDITVTGGTLHAKSNDGSVITCDGNFSVSGGAVDIEGKINSYKIGTLFRVTGGAVTTTGDIAGRDMVISGGNVDVGGELFAYGNITLGWTNLTDSIKAASYGVTEYIFIADGQQLTDGTDVYSGAYGRGDRDRFAGKTLVPRYTAWYELQYLIDHAQNGDTITMHTDAEAADDETALVIPAGKTLTLDLKGFTLDRHLTSQHSNGNAITNNGNLTITDSSDAQTGMITGGFNDVEGGAVKNNGTLTVEGGMFTNNTAKEGGAIANNAGATLNITGGSFLDNATHTWGGGGILNKGTMTVSGGMISSNSVSSASMNGGGIWTNGSLTITGGYVSGNTAASGGNGGGIYYTGGTLTVSGTPKIFGNTVSGNDNDLFINGNYTVTISDDLTGDALVGVRRRSEEINNAFTLGLSGRGDASSFFSNHSDYDVRLNNSGEAVLKKLYTITADTPEHGEVAADKASACEGDTVTLIVTPDEGYTIKTVSVNGSDIEAQNDIYCFTMPAENVTVTAEFDSAAYTITYEETAHGTVTGPLSARCGETVTLTVTPDTDCQFKTLTVYDRYHIPVLVSADHSFTMPTGNVTVTAEFIERTPYAVYNSAAGTLTFRYDFAMPGENAWELPFSTQEPPWKNTNTLKVIFDQSFSGYQPTSTAYWFYCLGNMTKIEGIEYLDTSAVTDMSYMFAQCVKLTSLDLSSFNTSAVTDMSYMFSYCLGLSQLNLSGFDTAQVTNMSDMFNTDSSLTALDLSDFDTSAVTNMNAMFYYCSDLETITVGSGWQTGSVTTSMAMFNGCEAITGGKGTAYDMMHIDKAYAHPDGGEEDPGYLTGIPYTITWKDYDATLINTTQVPCGDIPTHTDPVRENDDNYIYTFAGWDPEPVPVAGDAVYTATYSRTLKNYRYDKDTKELTLLWGDFSVSSKWGREIDPAQVKSVKANSGVRFVGDCSALFCGFTVCESIDLSNVDTSAMTNTALMFKNCTSLTSLDLTDVDTSSVTDMQNMFDSCESLTSLDLSGFHTALVVNMSRMFDCCKELTSLDLSSFDTSYVTDMSRMFGFCEELKTIKAGDSWTTDNVTACADMFTQCLKLTGGNGTEYQSQYNDKAYARIDGGPDAPGYFTAAYAVYTVTWKNDNGDTLKTDYNQKEGTTPVYTGETPVKADEGIYTYAFSGWSPKIRPVIGDAVYTATYTTSAQVSYIDENGETQSVNATVITGNQTALDGGWYAVTENVSLTERLTFNENANLILCDDATLSLNNTSSDLVSVFAKDLSVFGQENGSGKIAFTTGDDADAQVIYSDDLALYGGQIASGNRKDILLTNSELTVYGGSVKNAALVSFGQIAVNGGAVSVDTTFEFAIASTNGIAINGGNVYAKGEESGMFISDGSIDLSWTDTTDSVCANSYDGSVELKKPFMDNTTNEYEAGQVEDLTAIGGVTLYAIHDHSYERPVWTWAADNSSATAAFTCTICGHEESETADSVCELLDHQCQQPGNNHYTVSVSFDSRTYSDEKTVHVEATEHTYDSGRTLLKVHCMRDGLVRYTCRACGVIKDVRVQCRGYHDWTEREISYEEYKEEVEQGNAANHSAHSHSDLAATGSPDDLHYTMKECKDCNTKLIKGADGKWYERFDESEWEDDASTCASESDLADLAGEITAGMAAEAEALGASGIAISELAGDVLGEIFGLFAALFGSASVSLSLDLKYDYECTHEKVRQQTKAPTCTESGSYEVICYKCGRVFDTGSIDALGHLWSGWTRESVDENTLLATETRLCTRCQKKEEQKRRIAVADLMIQYTDDGNNYVVDPYSTDGTGTHCKCSVTFTDYASWISCTPTHAVDYENASDYFTFIAIEKNGYEFVGWYYSDGSKITDQTLASRPKVGKNVYYARFKKRSLDIEYKLYDDSDKSGGSEKSGKLKVEVDGETYEKSFTEGQSSCTVSIDHEHLTSGAEFRVTLTMDPKDKCAFIKDVRTDCKGSEVRGQKNRKISRDDDDDIHVMKKTEHSYTLSMSELLDDGKLNVTKVQYATDLEKGVKIAVDKTDTNKFPGCSTKIQYKLNGENKWRTATDGVTLIYHRGDKFAISAVTGEGKSFDGWRENLKIITAEQDYNSTVYADATYTPIFRYTTIRANYVDIFGNFIATKAIGEEPPTPYQYSNYEFTGWDKEPTEIIENGEIITAQYRKLHHKVTVTAEQCTITGTVDNSDKTETDSLAVDYDTYVTVTKPGTAYWTLNDKTVCYGDTYTFLAEVDVTLVAHETTPGEENPLVEIISVKKISETDYRLEFIATRYIPENCQFIQAGFVCGKDLTDEDLNLDNIGKQGSNPGSGTVKVGYCESTENHAEFSMTYGIKDQNAPATAKAFISYTDENGDVQILYSGMVTFNYQ